MKIGYDKTLNNETQQAFSIAGTAINYSQASNSKTDIEFFEDFIMQHDSDEIILYNLESIGTFTLVQLYNVLNIIEEKNIASTFLDTSFTGVNIKQDYLEVLRGIVLFDKKAMQKRTVKGIDLAKNNGIVGGRPTIHSDLQNKISFLHFNKKISLRDISEELNISLSTVYKYKNKAEKNNLDKKNT